MAVLQHYYTSYTDMATGRAGFQTKAMSPGLSPAQEALIQGLISYRIPSALDLRASSTHPIALRYLPLASGEAVLLCSQSCGSDENGRPGNFFSHSLLFESQTLLKQPPAFYWRSSFWCYQDNRPYPQEKSLPRLAAFEAMPGLSLASIWEFLGLQERREWLHQLLCAIVGHNQAQRRILIVDTPGHIALWIASASLFLPPDYRSLLSFATYYHDPRQSQFLLTGVWEDTLFQASDYQTFFILNPRQHKISPVEKSIYADTVSAWAQADLYRTQLLPFFTALSSVLVDSQTLGTQLDDLVLFDRLPALPAQTSIAQVQRLWSLSGSARNPHSQALFQATLDLAGQWWSEERYAEGNDLLGTAWQAIQVEAASWLAGIPPQSINSPALFSQWSRYAETCVLFSSEQLYAQLLAFWFSASPDLFKQPYTLPAFFLALAQTSMLAQKQRKRDVFPQGLLKDNAWYPVLESISDGQKRPLFGITASLWKREKVPVGVDTARFFTVGTMRQAHRELVLAEQHSALPSFWENYWKRFVETLFAPNPAVILEIFAFWFEEGFHRRAEQNFCSAMFFLHVPGICQKATHERAWRDSAAVLLQQAQREKRSWYEMLKILFKE